MAPKKKSRIAKASDASLPNKTPQKKMLDFTMEITGDGSDGRTPPKRMSQMAKRNIEQDIVAITRDNFQHFTREALWFQQDVIRPQFVGIKI